MTRRPSARVLEVQRMSTDDGPGIRTTVFFKGCPLSCAWCHNPESISARPQTQWSEVACIGCRLCLAACPQGALTAGEKGPVIESGRCAGCGTCADQCPAAALQLLGREWTVPELAAELVKDRAFFATSGGGVTLSGGEPLVQAELVTELLERLRQAGVHTALDTCGQVPWRTLERALPHCDLVLYDVKEIDPARHRAEVGTDNQVILGNLTLLAAWIGEHGGPELWVRTPLIPGATANPDNLRGIGAFLARHAGGALVRWELCAFNNLCRDKYLRLGLQWPFAAAELLTEDELGRLAEVARSSGVDPAVVHPTGATRQAAAATTVAEAG